MTTQASNTDSVRVKAFKTFLMLFSCWTGRLSQKLWPQPINGFLRVCYSKILWLMRGSRTNVKIKTCPISVYGRLSLVALLRVMWIFSNISVQEFFLLVSLWPRNRNILEQKPDSIWLVQPIFLPKDNPQIIKVTKSLISIFRAYSDSRSFRTFTYDELRWDLILSVALKFRNKCSFH